MLFKLLLIASAIAVAAVVAFVLTGCTLLSDNEFAQKNNQRDIRERTAAARAVTARTPRGDDLAGAALESALAGRTLVLRYGAFPDGKAGDHVVYQYFRPDGRFVVVDNWLAPSMEPEGDDYWDVSGPRVCFLNYRRSGRVRCFRVAQATDGSLQFYTDETGKPYDGLLESVVYEILDGPPPLAK